MLQSLQSAMKVGLFLGLHPSIECLGIEPMLAHVLGANARWAQGSQYLGSTYASAWTAVQKFFQPGVQSTRTILYYNMNHLYYTY